MRLPAEQGGNATIAGVAEGIGVRYRIDPTVVRVVFVATALVGGGITAYLLCWLLMPRYSVPKSPGELAFTSIDDNSPGAKTLKSEQSTGWLLMFFLLIFSGGAGIFSGEAFSIGFLSVLALSALAFYGLHQRTPIPPEGLLAQAHPLGEESVAEPLDQPSPTPQVDLSHYTPAEGFDAPYQVPQPPKWDPLGAAPALWHLPDPPEPPKPEPKPRHPLRWVPVAVVVAAVASSGLLIVRSDDGIVNVGDTNATITHENQLEDVYRTDVGTIDLDLSELDSLSRDRTVELVSSVGDIYVTLPSNVHVELDCSVRVGDVTCSESPYAEGPTLTLIAHSGIGGVKITP